MGNLFRGSRVKLKRALMFIDEVDAGLQEFDSNNPTSASLGPVGTMTIHRKEIDPYVLAALGDAVHNMRTALDLMASELARINHESDEDIYFPFSKFKEGFQEQIDRKHFHKAGDDAVALIKKFEPYSDGNKMLRAIHDLDIRDKHTDILVTQIKITNLQLSYRLDQGPNPPISVSATNIHEFLDGALAGQPIIKTLKELVQLVDGIVEAFARMVDLRNAVNGK